MLVRICFVVCAAILLVSASPVPQDSVETVLPLGNEQIEPITSEAELPESNSDAVKSGTEDPDKSDSNNGTKTQTESEEEEILGTQDTPTNNEGNESGNKSEGDDESVTSSDADEFSDDENVPQPESDVSEDGSVKFNDESESDSSNDEKNKSDSDNNGNDIENDEESENDEPSSEDGDYDVNDQEYEQDISIIKVNGALLRTYRIQKSGEEIICQEFINSGRSLDKQCFNSPRLLHHSTENIVSVHNKYIDGHNFICQEIINFVKGPLQVLCATEYQYFYEKSPIIDV